MVFEAWEGKQIPARAKVLTNIKQGRSCSKEINCCLCQDTSKSKLRKTIPDVSRLL